MQIRIDASQISTHQINVPNVTPGAVDKNDVSRVYGVKAGTYAFMLAGILADFTFRVTDTGTIDSSPRSSEAR